MTQGSLARGMSKLRRAPRSARPRGPSALPSNHEIVSDGCELSPHAYRFVGSCDPTCDPHPQLEQTQGVAWPTQSKQYDIDKLRMSYGPAWPNLKQAVKGMKEIIELAKAGQLPPLDEPPPTA